MYIECISAEDNQPMWINVDSVVSFYRNDRGGTDLVFSREGLNFMSVKEEPYVIWARIRAEETTARTPVTRSFNTGPG